MTTLHLVHTPVRAEQAAILDADGAEQALAHTIGVALHPLCAAALLERATVYPWIVVTDSRRYDPNYCGGALRTLETIHVVQAPMHQPPCAEDFVPEGWEFRRGDVFPAARLEDMRPTTRRSYERHYKAYLAWRHALAGLPTDDECVGPRADAWLRAW